MHVLHVSIIPDILIFARGRRVKLSAQPRNMKNQYLLIGLLIVVVLVLVLVMSGGNTTEETSPDTATTPDTTQVTEEETLSDNNQEMPMNNIVETAQEAGSFKTLLTAVQAAGLEDTLANGGPFTVFAPTDEAFEKLPEGTVESLLEDTDQLTQVLTYHVVEGKVMAEDVAGLESATTLQGGELEINTSNGVMVNNANVVTTDVEASNGVIHVIDTVLLPESE